MHYCWYKNLHIKYGLLCFEKQSHSCRGWIWIYFASDTIPGFFTLLLPFPQFQEERCVTTMPAFIKCTYLYFIYLGVKISKWKPAVYNSLENDTRAEVAWDSKIMVSNRMQFLEWMMEKKKTEIWFINLL